MSDHWNLLADLLGTPNYAPRSKKGPKSGAASEPTTPTKEAQPTKSAETTASAPADREAPKTRKTTESNSKKVRAFAEPIAEEVADDVVIDEELPREINSQEIPAKEAKERSMLQSSWDALASLFGVSNDTAQATPPAAKGYVSESSSHSKPETATRPTRAKRTTGKSMWNADEETKVESQKPESTERTEAQALETENPLPSFGEPSSSLEKDRRGPRRSPRRGQGKAEPAIEISAEARDESTLEQDRPARRERSERGDSRRRQPESNRSRDEDRGDRRSKSDDDTRATRPSDSLEDRDRLRERPQREDRRRERAPGIQGTKEPATRTRGGSGFAAGLSSDIDDRPTDSFGFGREDDFRNDQGAVEPPIGFGVQEEDQDSERPRRKKRRGRRRDGERSDEKSEGFDSDSESFEDSDEAERSSEPSETRPRHGKIPSWAETIGVVVQANVANHQKQSSSGRSRHRRPSN